jgi:hypothetical protein
VRVRRERKRERERDRETWERQGGSPSPTRIGVAFQASLQLRDISIIFIKRRTKNIELPSSCCIFTQAFSKKRYKNIKNTTKEL